MWYIRKYFNTVCQLFLKKKNSHKIEKKKKKITKLFKATDKREKQLFDQDEGGGWRTPKTPSHCSMVRSTLEE